MSEEKPILQFKVVTTRTDGKLTTTIDLYGAKDHAMDIIRRYSHSAVDLQERHLQSHLVALGWTPPAIVKAKLEEFEESVNAE